MYTMVRDQCSKGVPVSKPMFEVVGDFKRWKPRIPTSVMRVLHVTLHDNRMNDNQTIVSTSNKYNSKYC